MKLNSLQFKFLSIMISAVLTISVFVGAFSIFEVDNYVQQQTEDLVKITCSNEASHINNVFGDMEKSVRIMESYVLSFFESKADVENYQKLNEASRSAEKMFSDLAKNTDGAIAYYLRYDPAISDSTSGLFYSKIDGQSGYVRFAPTDLSIYDKNDIEHVGWFWLPYEAGKPIWIAPYYNQNNNILMISYTVPLYCDSQFIGVVGMDFDYTVLTKKISEIKIYDNGFAHLELDGVVVDDGSQHSQDAGLQKSTEEYLIVSEELTNGMTLVLSASYDDIRQIRYAIANKILILSLVMLLFFSVVVFFTVKTIIKPLKKLTDAAIKISHRDYNIDISHSNTYEIDTLSSAFDTMITNLREHEKVQHRLSYRDPLTGLRNMTSYKKWEIDLNKKITEGNISFGIIVLDINNLKKTNDTYGHSAGNKLIEISARLISDTFKRSPVFRIGGDEFLVFLQDRDLKDLDRLLLDFDSICENTFMEINNEKIEVHIAKGFSMFEPTIDTQLSDVFRRADSEMYINKKKSKLARE